MNNKHAEEPVEITEEYRPPEEPETFPVTREQMEKMEGLAARVEELEEQRLRLSAEYADIELDGDMYEVLVNGGKLGYEGIKFEGAQAATSNEKVLPFEDFVISAAVNLRAGDNVITLRTANSIKQGTGGTMNSTAPLVDCVKIATEKTALTWTEGYKANGNY